MQSIGIGLNLPDGMCYCCKCEYPMNVGETCQHCEDAAREKRDIFNQITACWGGDRAYSEFTLEKFQPRDSIAAEALKMSTEWNPASKNLFIWGGIGAGKTHLAVAAARRFWSEQAPYRVYWKPSQIARAIRFAENAAEEQAIIDRLVRQELLIIDDLGVEKRTEFMDQALYEIIDGRDMRTNGGLVVTSNYELDMLSKVLLGGDRLPSRICRASTIINLQQAQDYRANPVRS